MKNKHLVLIFMSVLLLGLILRQIPWHCRETVGAPLVKLPAEDIYRIRIDRADGTELLLERTPLGWTAEQSGRTVFLHPDTAQNLLRLLTQPIPLKQLDATDRRVLNADDAPLFVHVYAERRPTLSLQIGPQLLAPNGPQTLVRFVPNKSPYRAHGALRTPFDRTLDDFRNRQILPSPLHPICRIELRRPNDSIFVWEENHHPDSAELALPPKLQFWLNSVAQLSELPFADFFDESREKERLILSAVLTSCSGQVLTLRFFALQPPDLPEDIELLLRQRIRVLPRYVLHSSINPTNYFALLDAESGDRICNGP